LLQRADGGYDMTPSLAFALQAHDGARPPPKPPASKLRTLLGALLGDEDLDDELDDAVDDALTSSDDEDEPAAAPGDGEAFTKNAKSAKDCPLSFSRAAIRRRLPPALAALNEEYNRRMAEEAAAELERREAARIAAIAAEAQGRRRQALAAATDAAAVAAAADAAQVLQGNVSVRLKHAAAMAADTVHYALSTLLHETEEQPRAKKSVAARPPAFPRVAAAPAAATARRPFGSLAAPASAPTSATPSCSSPSELALLTHSKASSKQRRRRPRERVPVERIWSTTLALSVMEELDSSWLVDPDAEQMRTIVDAGREFLEAQSRADRRVKKLLKSGELRAAAKKARHEWKAIQNYNVQLLREADVINRFTALTHIQRASARVVRSMMTDHSTFATFLDTDGYIMRWQRFMILVTLVLSTLLTSIWFYYSRGANCCAEIRLILECDPIGPCMGYEGNCSDFQAQFAGVQGAYFFSDAPGEEPTEHEYIDDYVCHAFPDDAYVTDQFFVGLISVAVALPVDLFLARAFEIANEGDMPENWLDAPPGKWKLLLGKDMHNGWHLADAARPLPDFVLWLIGEQAEDFVTSLLALPLWLLGCLRGRCAAAAKPQWGAEADDDEEDHEGKDRTKARAATGKEEEEKNDAQSSAGGSSHASADARADALRKRLYASAGLLGVYTCWTIFAWCAAGPRVQAAPSGRARSRFFPAPRRRLRHTHTRTQVHLHLRHAHLHAAGRRRAERVRQNLGRRLRAKQRLRMAGCRHHGVQGGGAHRHPRRAAPHQKRILVRGAWCAGVRVRACASRRMHAVVRATKRVLCVVPRSDAPLRASVSQLISCPCRRCCSTAPRAAGGHRRARSSSCKRG
jgi:hypothetical protein